MREIKFRVWDAIDKRWYDHSEICDKLVFREDGWVGFLVEHIKLMQYTGLKDKNGKDVYEGDWVELKTPNKLPRFLSKTRDIDGRYAVTWGYAGFQYEREGEGLLNDTVGLGAHPHEVQIEVIGNIYENSELVK